MARSKFFVIAYSYSFPLQKEIRVFLTEVVVLAGLNCLFFVLNMKFFKELNYSLLPSSYLPFMHTPHPRTFFLFRKSFKEKNRIFKIMSPKKKAISMVFLIFCFL